MITVSAVLFAAFLIFCFYEWTSRGVYQINDPSSLVYMLVLYVVAILLYVGFRLYRRFQGIDLNMVYGDIPDE